MKPRICICCGEPMAHTGHVLSRNANLCASCSSIADGMLEDTLPTRTERTVFPANGMVELPHRVLPQEYLLSSEEPGSGEEVVVEWRAGRLRRRE